MAPPQETSAKPTKPKLDPFRRAVLRGVGLILPPLLTIAIFLWLGNTIATRLLEPLEDFARWTFIEMADIPSDPKLKADEFGLARIDGKDYFKTGDKKFVPIDAYKTVEAYLI